MRSLILDDNAISDLSPLTGLTQLTRLYLDNNAISDLSPLVANTGLDSGDAVRLTHNPIDCATQAESIQALRNRGVTLELDSFREV